MIESEMVDKLSYLYNAWYKKIREQENMSITTESEPTIVDNVKAQGVLESKVKIATEPQPPIVVNIEDLADVVGTPCVMSNFDLSPHAFHLIQGGGNMSNSLSNISTKR